MIPFAVLAIEDDSDRAFVTDLYLRYNRLMYAEILKIVKNQCDPEDVLSVTVIKLIEKLPTLKTMDEHKRVNYIITAAKHNAITAAIKQSKHSSNSITDDEMWEEIDRSGLSETVEESIDRRENVSRLKKVWILLDAKSRYLLSARYFLFMEDSEIAEELGIKTDSVRMELSRARKKVKDLLAEKFGMADIWS